MAKRHCDIIPCAPPLSKKGLRLAGEDVLVSLDGSVASSYLQQVGTSLQVGLIFTEFSSFAFALSEPEAKLFADLNQRCNLGSLESVDLSNSGITDSFMDVFSSVAPSLKRIDLARCAITDSSLMLMAVRSPNLSQINLEGCALITTQGLEFLLRNLKDQVRSLNISQCPGLDSRAVLSVVTYCPSISALSFGQVQVAPLILGRLARRCVSLTRLNISNVEVRGDFLPLLCKSVRKLDFLDVSFCKNITADAINSVIAKYPAIELRAFGVDLAGVDQGDSALLIF